jgi:hypothetical protein
MCLEYTGVSTVHDSSPCAVALSVLCQQCHVYGHLTSSCPDDWSNWVRPTSLEDLIPAYLRDQYNITTSTPFIPNEPRSRPQEPQEEQLERRRREGLQILTIPNYLDTTVDKNEHTGYDRLGLFMKTHGIDLAKWYPEHTKKTKEDGLERERAVKAWCIAKGYAVHIG